MTQSTSDILMAPLEKLERVLATDVAGRERDWAEQVRGALATMEVALRQHAAEDEAHDGLFTDVDLTRPTFVRQIGGLRQEHADLLAEMGVLQQQLKQAADVFRGPATAVPLASRLPEPAAPRTVPDFGRIRQAGVNLVAAVRDHSERETDLLLESVETDIGVGD